MYFLAPCPPKDANTNTASSASARQAKRARTSQSAANADCQRHERHIQEAQTALDNIRADVQHYGVVSAENDRLRRLLNHYREGLDKSRDVADSRQRTINALIEENKDLELKKADAVTKAKKEADERRRTLTNFDILRKDFDIRARMVNELRHSLRHAQEAKRKAEAVNTESQSLMSVEKRMWAAAVRDAERERDDSRQRAEVSERENVRLRAELEAARRTAGASQSTRTDRAPEQALGAVPVIPASTPQSNTTPASTSAVDVKPNVIAARAAPASGPGSVLAASTRRATRATVKAENAAV